MEIIKKLNYGDHIKIRRPVGFYEHHGIYKNDNEIIGYGGGILEGASASVRVVTLEQFLKGQNREDIEVVYHIDEYPPEETIRIAESHIGETQYNLITNNCEHFATLCKTGIKSSQQIIDAIAKTSNILPGGKDIVQTYQDIKDTVTKHIEDNKITENTVEFISESLDKIATLKEKIIDIAKDELSSKDEKIDKLKKNINKSINRLKKIKKK